MPKSCSSKSEMISVGFSLHAHGFAALVPANFRSPNMVLVILELLGSCDRVFEPRLACILRRLPEVSGGSMDSRSLQCVSQVEV